MDDRDDAILRSAKFKVPVPREGYVVREELFARLDMALQTSVTYVRGGAGTGKTMLLATFVKERGIAGVSWVSLDADDDDPYTFWLHVVAALTPTLDDDGDLLSIMQALPKMDRMDELIGSGIDQLDDGRERCLVLDDVQSLTDKKLLDSIEGFLVAMPANLHVVMLSRDEPPVYLGPVAVSGRLLLIDGNQMRLSADESSAFLRSTLKVTDDETISQLCAYAGGWVGGLQLAVAAGSSRHDVSRLFQAGNSIAEEYLTREVYEALDTQEREFLLGTGFLPYFDVDLCVNLFDGLTRERFDTMVAGLIAKGLFLVCIDETTSTYRYHGILADYLRRRLAGLPASEENEMRRRAVHAFALRGDFVEAMRQAISYDDWDEVMRYAHEGNGAAETWSLLGRVPVEVLAADLSLSVQRLMFDYCSLDFEHAQRLFRRLEEQHHGDDAHQVLRSLLPFFGDLSTSGSSIHVLALTDEQLDAFGLRGVARAIMLILCAETHMDEGRYTEAERQLREALRLSSKVNDMVALFAWMQLAQLYEEVGRLRDALACDETVGKLLARHDRQLIGERFSYRVGLAGVYMRQMRLDRAQLLLDELEGIIGGRRDGMFETMWLTCEQHHVEMLLLRGEVQQGVSLAREDVYDNPELHPILYLRVIYELLCLGVLSDDLAKETLDEIREERHHKEGKGLVGRLVAARIVFDFAAPGQDGADDRDAGLRETNLVLACARELGNGRILVAAALQRARMEAMLSSPSARKMSDLLREAISYAAPEQMVMPFYLERAGIMPLLHGLVTQEGDKRLLPAESAFVRRVVSLSMEETPALKTGFCALTDREQEVLNELASGITNREIAERLFISQATVKTHVLSIFSKLGVSSRTMAVEQARSLGLLHTA